jgi:hypothetical protein
MSNQKQEAQTPAQDDSEKSIVEKVFNERNFTTGMELARPQGAIHHETELGTVRIEGEVTPEKLELARQFHEMFAAATGEIESLAEYKPPEEMLDLVKSGAIDDARLAEIKAAKPWTVFKVNLKYLLKTPDNKLEEVKDYCYRLERAVLAQIGIRKQADEAARNSLKFVQEQLDIALRQNEAYEKHLTDLKNKVVSKLPQIFAEPKRKTALWLKLKPHFAKIKAVLEKLFSEEIP